MGEVKLIIQERGKLPLAWFPLRQDCSACQPQTEIPRGGAEVVRGREE
ncbi:MAG: hypothetical protein ACOYXA_13675 [Bacteroidota bacterium]